MSLLRRFSEWRRRRVVERHRFEPALWRQVFEAYPFLACLDAGERERLAEQVALFCADKEFAAADGFELTPAVQLSIAAQACLPVLNLDLALYAGWHGIVVYPGEVVARREFVDEDGIVHEYDEVIAGEAMPGGPVVLSWEDVAAAGSPEAPAYNVVVHEFAHKIDMADGVVDGRPPFLPGAHAGFDARGLVTALESAYQAFARKVERWEGGGGHAAREPLIDPYAAENPVEFFAVVSEAFFTQPVDVCVEFPALYDRLAGYYRQDPRARLARA